MRTPRTHRQLTRWLWPVALLGAVATLVAVAPPASAATVISSSGERGYWAIADTAASPGARCVYDPPGGGGYAYLAAMTVRAPVVRARNVTASRDSQRVAWRVLVQTSMDASGPWTEKAASTWAYATAYDDTRAQFVARTVASPTNFTGYARAVVQIRWIRGGATEGRVEAVVNRYNVRWEVGIPTYVYSRPCDTRPD